MRGPVSGGGDRTSTYVAGLGQEARDRYVEGEFGANEVASVVIATSHGAQPETGDREWR